MTIAVSHSPEQDRPITARSVKRNDRPTSARQAFPDNVNPVLETSEWALRETGIVSLNEDGIKTAAKYIHTQMQCESYTPRTWRTHPLHLCPAEPFSWTHPSTRACMDWVFLISSLNFSFWSEFQGERRCYGVQWREGWASENMTVHTGYWSLVAAVDRALEEGIPITDPTFYASETRCPDSLIEHVFRAASQSAECIPLLRERIAILREVGAILCQDFEGSFYGFFESFRRRFNNRGTALQLVKMVTDTFPSFRDEHIFNGRRVYIWKRAQILVAETWAAFFPEEYPATPHPLFPSSSGAAIEELTMFADYRVPQILHHLRILSYPPALVKLLNARTPLASGSMEEISIRAASVVAVERVRREILNIIEADAEGDQSGMMDGGENIVSSVLIDFYLWDLAKRVEGLERGGIEGVETTAMLPTHRTRSIWY